MNIVHEQTSNIHGKCVLNTLNGSCVLLQEALSSLQLSAEQVNAVVCRHLLSLIGQKQNRDEMHLAAVQVSQPDLTEM